MAKSRACKGVGYANPNTVTSRHDDRGWWWGWIPLDGRLSLGPCGVTQCSPLAIPSAVRTAYVSVSSL